MILPAAISQRTYLKAGDIDDCWAVATVWAAVAAGQTYRPDMTVFRAAAGNPDKPGPTGGDYHQIARAVSILWPSATFEVFAAKDWPGFVAKLYEGWIASLAVLSAKLPPPLRYNFYGTHQLGVGMAGGLLYVMNPLMTDGDSLKAISESELKTATLTVADGWVLAVLFQPTTIGDLMIQAVQLTSPKRLRMTKAGDLLDSPGGAKVASFSVGYTYPYIGLSSGFRAVLVGTAIPYSDHMARPTVLYTAADASNIEDVPVTPSSAQDAANAAYDAVSAFALSKKR